ncbi:hypothetical protein K466DRAFT_149670 [Polyporus arcularius HHB13444]|uniref:MYND-type domain-containing protein n=1 Tax=Polyporus arcularius HHB13444 TaxID=1314778 RepID=A0A5C3PC27_9APHY|nr:hypothetical protein K466DRAFT_149670 [Polyporus arcularius HHB13444]
MGAGSDDGLPTPPAVKSIVATLRRHILILGPASMFNELLFLTQTILHHRNSPVPFAANSEDLWPSLVEATRLAPADVHGLQLFTAIIQTHHKLLEVLALMGEQAHFDDVLYRSLSAGFFDAIDERTCDFLQGDAITLFACLLRKIQLLVPYMSARTRALVNSKLPRPRIPAHLFSCCMINECEAAFQATGMLRGSVVMDDPTWAQATWRALNRLQVLVEVPGQCSRRGCDMQTEQDGAIKCPECGFATWCSDSCLLSDAAEHAAICRWMPMVMEDRDYALAEAAGQNPQHNVGFYRVVDGHPVKTEL